MEEFLFLLLVIAVIVNFIEVHKFKKELDLLKKKIQQLTGVDRGFSPSAEQKNVANSYFTNNLNNGNFNKMPNMMPNWRYNEKISLEKRKSTPLPQVVEQNSLENVFGKNIIGVVAAILIFIGIIAFGALVFNSITDGVKVLLIFLSSFLMSGLGVFLVKKNSNAFTNSILGCGFGAIFVSIFVTHLYFHMLSDIVAFIFVFLWLLAVYLVGKVLKSKMLLYISHIGCVISIFMTLPYRIKGDMLAEITIYQVISTVVLLVLDYIEVRKSNILDVKSAKLLYNISLIFTMCFNLLWGSSLGILMMKEMSSSFLIIVLSILMIAINSLMFIASQREAGTGISVVLGILNSISIVSILSAVFFQYMKVNMQTEYVEFLVLGEILSCLYIVYFIGKFLYRQNFKENIQLPIVLCATIVTLLEFSPCVNGIEFVVLISFVALCFMTYIYFRKRDISYFIISVVQFAITSVMIFGYLDSNIILSPIVYSILLLGVLVCLMGVKFGDIFEFPVAYFFFYNIHLLVCLQNSIKDLELSIPLTAIIIMGMNVLFYIFLNWAKTFKKGSSAFKVSEILTYILEVVILFCYSIYMGIEAGDSFLSSKALSHFGLFILALLMLFFGLVRLIALIRSKKAILGVWYGLKITWLTIYPMSLLTDLLEEQLIFSIACMVIALLCIFFGFKFNIKSVRVYGLILTLMSVLKIVIADVWGQDSIIRVISLILGGVICFAISATYNYIEKRRLIE